MSPATTQQSLAGQVEAVIREVLGCKATTSAGASGRVPIQSYAAAIAQILNGSPGDPTPFRRLASPIRVRREIARAARYAAAGRPLPPLHANSIKALAAAGWMRADLAAHPSRAKAAATSAVRRLGEHDASVGPADGRRRNDRAWALTTLLAGLYQSLSGRPATHTGPFLTLLERVAELSPVTDLGNLSYLAQAVTAELRARPGSKLQG